MRRGLREGRIPMSRLGPDRVEVSGDCPRPSAEHERAELHCGLEGREHSMRGAPGLGPLMTGLGGSHLQTPAGCLRRRLETSNKTDPTVEPITVVDPATPPEAAPTPPRGTPEEGAPKDAPPPETQRELEQMPVTGTKEGEEIKASAKAPVKAKRKKKGKQPKKKEESSGDVEEKEEAWHQVKSQRLRDKCREEKEEKER
ncbi:hypothetical protein NDU88_004026 [Pleurodeles waltl]|uniref:Uncharacterized protein n=1 Tax=Pleurodeles waltl TaxID=8319 RepID=A0AAV7RET3_PLEWA|nr:hypothetical protein NDU88_004026 [Pleurodeles waltl]